MIRFLRHEEIDRHRWDEVITHSPEGTIYAESWFLDAVCPVWHALVEDDYKAVFPLTWRKKYGLHYLFQPPFCQQLGLFSKQETPLIDAAPFLEAIPKHYRLVELQLNSGNRCTHPAFTVTERPNLELRLQRDYAALAKGYSDNTSRNLRKAQQSGLVVETSDSIEPVIRLFRDNRGSTLERFDEQQYERLRSLAGSALEKGRGIIRLVQDPSGQLHAGAFFVQSKDRLIFLFSGTSAEARKSGAMSALIDRVIHAYAGTNMRLDFEGSVDPNLARFYRSFGSEEVVYLQIRRNRLPFPFRLFKS
ncbi:MAG TPA: GNAT family N-acetyltransferase [Bacteroidia bacterium]|nr:GNAT family N-acetyltransferase [Bacteroidia bacterium]